MTLWILEDCDRLCAIHRASKVPPCDFAKHHSEIVKTTASPKASSTKNIEKQQETRQ